MGNPRDNKPVDHILTSFLIRDRDSKKLRCKNGEYRMKGGMVWNSVNDIRRYITSCRTQLFEHPELGWISYIAWCNKERVKGRNCSKYPMRWESDSELVARCFEGDEVIAVFVEDNLNVKVVSYHPILDFLINSKNWC